MVMLLWTSKPGTTEIESSNGQSNTIRGTIYSAVDGTSIQMYLD